MDQVFNDNGVCYAFCFLPAAFYVYGWFKEDIQYDSIEIFVGEKKIGNAELQIERSNILLHYGNTTSNHKGWRFYLQQEVNFDLENEVKAIAKLSAKKQGEINTQIRGISIKKSLEQIKRESEGNKNILVIPGNVNKVPMLQKIAENLPEYNFITLNEAVPEDKVLSKKELNEKCKEEYPLMMMHDNLQISCMPLIFYKNKYLSKYDIYLNEQTKEILQESPYLSDFAQTIREKFPNMSESYSLFYVCTFRDYVEKIIKETNPAAVLLWNQFFPLHSILVKVCRKNRIPIIFCESGVLPGTIAFEDPGQMGESFPATKWEQFKQLDIDGFEYDYAIKVRNYLYESKLNRWAQYGVYNKLQIEEAKQKLLEGRPIIFYAGQNDYESGIKPYTDDTANYHSPIFTGSYEAAVFLAEISAKNKWNFIYKRHPMMKAKRATEILPDNVINYDELDIHDIIDLADVTITILSQTAYIALIRKKPVVMLGYNQLRGKECTYEAFQIDMIEKAINDAINCGYTDMQEKSFIKHIAQLNKYYLYGNFTEQRLMNYGKNEEELFKYIRETIEGGK